MLLGGVDTDSRISGYCNEKPNEYTVSWWSLAEKCHFFECSGKYRVTWSDKSISVWI